MNTDQEFRAIVLNRNTNSSRISIEPKRVTLDDLSSGDTVIKVAYSSINYKDVLAFQTNGLIIRNYPMIPGVDFAGTVVETQSDQIKAGDKVVGTGYGIGVSHTGGLSEYVRVPAEWLIKLDPNASLKYIMSLGTAGLTAGLSVKNIESAGLDCDSAVMVTGVTGGVGGLAVTILREMGVLNISALVRKNSQRKIAERLGVQHVYLPEDLETNKPLNHQKFDFVIDTVGGTVLESILPWVSYQGAVTVCGNVAGNQAKISMLPFILRGIRMIGIDSVNISVENKRDIWQSFLTRWMIADQINSKTYTLDQVPYLVTNWSKLHVGVRSIVRL